MTPSVLQIPSAGHTLPVQVAGSGPLCVLVHGWPETSWSWRHQVGPLVGAGYRVAVPDVRGYGGSSAPREVEAYGMRALTGDVIAILDALDAPTATLIGHDWGAPIVWHTALLHPERVTRVVGLSVPHLGRGSPMPPSELFATLYVDRFFYISYFQRPGVPEAELQRDVRDALTRIYVMNSGDSTPAMRQAMRERKTGYLDGVPAPEALPAWLTEHGLDVYEAAFTQSGFHGGLHRYRNMDPDWHDLAALAEVPIPRPAWFIVGEHDSVLRYAPGTNLLDVMDPFYADLRAKRVIEGAGHWVQQERPAAVNAALLEFLGPASSLGG